MRVLYLAEDYIGTKVHHNLCNRLMTLYPNAEITIYCYARTVGTELDNSSRFSDKKYNVIVSSFSGNIRRFKYDYSYRNGFKYKDLKENVNIRSFDVVYAATMFSEGSIALKIYEEYKIPYIVAIRGTDMRTYMGKAFPLWPMGRKIVKNALRIVFITPNIKKETKSKLFSLGLKNTIEAKSEIIPNAIEDYWHDNLRDKQKEIVNRKLLYIGRFDANKNVEALQKAVLELRPKYPDIKLVLVGGKGSRQEQVLNVCNQYPETFEYKGPIYDKAELKDVMRDCCAFTMASHSETFGLVYIEAMSQGLPVLYSKNQGIDGFFVENVGEAVYSRDEESIKTGLDKILSDYNSYKSIIHRMDDFTWNTVAAKYQAMLNAAANQIGGGDCCKSVGYRDIKLLVKRMLFAPRIMKHNLSKKNEISYTTEVRSHSHFQHCKIGKYCFVQRFCDFNHTVIGNYTSIAANVMIGGMEHPIHDLSMSTKLSDKAISNNITTIGNDVWIATHCTIRQGVSIGDGAVVGANSFVNKDIPPYAIAVGSPAKVIGYRFPEETIAKLQDSRFWENSPEEARIILSKFKMYETKNTLD